MNFTHQWNIYTSRCDSYSIYDKSSVPLLLEGLIHTNSDETSYMNYSMTTLLIDEIDVV